MLQLCDRVEGSAYAVLRAELPGVGLIQVVHVTGAEAIAEAPHVDAILLDFGDRSGPVKALGGTGRVHDWGVSRRIREAVDVPVFLAGGPTAANVAEAIQAVGPYAVDVCNGVRTDGHLDEAKLAAFVAALPPAERP